MHLFQYIPERLFNEARERKLISATEHPELPLVIYHYTPPCAIQGLWGEATVKSRGLLVNSETLEIVGAVMSKFFRDEDWPASFARPMSDDTDYIITEKLDGVLVYVTEFEGERIVWTRTGFDNDAVTYATAMLDAFDLRGFDLESLTLGFELIHPKQRVIVDYGDVERLVLIDVISNVTALPVGYDAVLVVARRIGAETPPERSLLPQEYDQENRDGVVLRYRLGLYRKKVKTEWYMERARFLPTLTSRRVLEKLRDGSLSSWIVKCPSDEWIEWMADEATTYILALLDLKKKALAAVSRAYKELETDADVSRKEFALWWRANASDVPARHFFGELDKKGVDYWVDIEAPAHRKPLAGYTIAR